MFSLACGESFYQRQAISQGIDLSTLKIDHLYIELIKSHTCLNWAESRESLLCICENPAGNQAAD